MEDACIGAGFLHIFRDGHDAVVGAEGGDVISAAYVVIEMREKIAKILVQPHKDVLNLAAAGAEFVANVVHRRVADGEKISSHGSAKIQRVHGLLGKFGQSCIGVGAGGPLLVESAVRFTDAGFSTERVRKSEIPAVGRNSTESFLTVQTGGFRVDDRPRRAQS